MAKGRHGNGRVSAKRGESSAVYARGAKGSAVDRSGRRMGIATVNISMPEPMKEFVEGQVTAGGYSSASEYMRSLIRQAQDKQARAELEAKLVAGVEALERGEGRRMTRADWKRLRERVIQRQGKRGSR